MLSCGYVPPSISIRGSRHFESDQQAFHLAEKVDKSKMSDSSTKAGTLFNVNGLVAVVTGGGSGMLFNIRRLKSITPTNVLIKVSGK